MSKIVIVGNGLSAIGVAQGIRAADPEASITLFCPEGVLPYDPSLLAGYLAKQVKEHQLYARPDAFFKEHGIDIVLNEGLSRISTKRKYVAAESKKQFAYDRLIVADLGAVLPLPLKGHNKEGIFDATRLRSIKALAKHVPFIDHTVVCVSHFSGLNTACALHTLGKDVTILSAANTILPAIFDEETSALLKQIFEAKGIKVLLDTALEEILGDAEVKAVRLKTGKVIAAEAVVVDDLKMDTRVFTDDLPAEGVEVLEEGGGTRAAHDFGIQVLNGSCAGTVRLIDGGLEYMQFDSPDNIYKKVFVHDGRLAGFVLFNAPGAKAKLLRDFLDGKAVAQTKEELFHEYFQPA